jgi:hypothetical protein
MALEDSDKAEIAEMIASATRSTKPPARTPPEGPKATQGDWDQMGERDRQTYVRTIVEDHLASLDAEAERAELRQRVKELETERKEWEKGGRKGPRPTKAAGDKGEEQTPTIVSKAYTWLFGAPTSS